MLDNLKLYKIKLASNSPRRKELLAGLDVDFETQVIPGLEEFYPETLPVSDVALYLAKQKADAYRNTITADTLLITADTVVCTEGRLLGKPSTQEEAKEMLRSLSGKEHEVITGVCILTSTKACAFDVSTHVTFATLDEAEIAYYVSKYQPLDKAGSYGIQEWIGYIGITQITGSYFNVMGLPVQRLYQELKQL